MKKTQRKDAIRNIWRKKVSWISVAIVTMLTVGVFLGCRSYSASMGIDGKKYYTDHNYQDIEVISRTGFLDSELEQFRNLEGVIDVEGYHQLDVTVDFGTKNEMVNLILKTERISTPELIEGRLPEKEGELAVSTGLQEDYHLKIGETLHLSADEEQDKLLATHDFVITGFVNHPGYMQVTKNQFLLAADTSFDTEDMNGGHLRALVRVEYPDSLNIYSNKYYETILPVEERIQALFPDMIETHKSELFAVADKKIMDETEGPRQKLRDAEKELSDGKKKLDEGEEKLLSAKEELEQGERDLADGKKKLEDGKKKLENGKKDLDDGEKQYAEKKEQFDTKSAEAKKQISDAKSKLNSAESEAKSGLNKLDSVESTLRRIVQDLGESDLSGNYYSLKEQAEKNYEAAMQAAVEQKDNSELLKKAEQDTNAAVDARLDRLGIVKALNSTTFRRITEFAKAYYGDITVLDFLKGSKAILDISDEDMKELIAYLEQKDPSLKLSGVITELEKSEEVKEILDEKVSVLPDKLRSLIRQYFNGYGKALAAKKAVGGAKEGLAEKEKAVNEELSKAEQQLKEGRDKLDAAKKKLEDGQAEYDQNLEKYQEGLEKYESGKADYEKGLEEFKEKQKTYQDGEKKYLDGKRELEEKIEEARDKVRERLDGYFAVQNRRANEGFVNLKSNISMISNASLAFIALFLVVSAMVTFSTIAIIVDEQRNLAGAMKSLGFFNKDIRAKYLVFGLSAAVVGVLAGVAASFGVQQVFRYGVTILYVFGRPSISFNVLTLIIAAVLLISVVIIAIYASTNGMLKMSAIQLMSGMKKERTLRGKDEQEKKGGLYKRLIFRNMKTEIERVAITTLIIAISCSLIGVGFNLKNAFGGMIDLQVEDVWGYDLKVSYDQDSDQWTRYELERVIRESGASYASVSEIPTIYRDKELEEYTYILVMDQNVVGDFYHVIDWDTGKEMTIPEDGVLIQNRLYETRNLGIGDTYTLYDHKLKEHTVEVRGVYSNHVGRTVIMSREGYYNLFGTTASDNTFLIRLNGVSQTALLGELAQIIPEITYETPEKLQNEFKPLRDSYNSVVYLLTGMAIFMSIFVLANLTNIFISRRRKEMIVMRVNGFSTKQCIGYLIRETIITAVAGFVIAVIVGGLLSRMMVTIIEQPDTMMDRRFQPISWVIAVLLEAVFAFCIDFYVFRKVRKLKVTDINA